LEGEFSFFSFVFAQAFEGQAVWTDDEEVFDEGVSYVFENVF
jgi:hypothetical protein